jgi:hypothetical protein
LSATPKARCASNLKKKDRRSWDGGLSKCCSVQVLGPAWIDYARPMLRDNGFTVPSFLPFFTAFVFAMVEFLLFSLQDLWCRLTHVPIAIESPKPKLVFDLAITLKMTNFLPVNYSRRATEPGYVLKYREMS